MQDKIIASRVLVDTWMLTVKLVYKLSNVPDDLKWTTNTFDTICTHFQGITYNMYGFGKRFFVPSFFIHPPPIHPYFYPSIFVFTHPNDRWSGLCIKLWSWVSLIDAFRCLAQTHQKNNYVR